MSALRVLHVDDEPDIREVVELSLALDPEFTVKSCGSGNEALAAVADWPPDLVLLDVMMPVMDGPTTLRRLREQSPTVTTPVVFMTARAQAREIESFISLGAVGVIPKPFDPMTLAASVRNFAHPPAPKDQPAGAGFTARMARDAAALAVLRDALTPEGATEAALQEIRDLAHGLAGAGGIFGFPAVTDRAAVLAQATEAMLDARGTMAEVHSSVDALLATLAQD